MARDEAKKAVKKEKELRQKLLEEEAFAALLAEVEKTFKKLQDENKKRHPLGDIYDDQLNIDHGSTSALYDEQEDVFDDLEEGYHPL